MDSALVWVRFGSILGFGLVFARFPVDLHGFGWISAYYKLSIVHSGLA